MAGPAGPRCGATRQEGDRYGRTASEEWYIIEWSYEWDVACLVPLRLAHTDTIAQGLTSAPLEGPPNPHNFPQVT